MTLENASIRKSQGNVDRINIELREELDRIKTLESGNGSDPSDPGDPGEQDPQDPQGPEPDPEPVEVEKAAFDRKLQIFDMAIERGLDPRHALALLGEGDDDQKLDAISDIKKSATDAFLKGNGRNPLHDVQMRLDPMTPAAAAMLPADQMKKLPPETLENIGRQISENESAAKGGGSLRERLSRTLFKRGE